MVIEDMSQGVVGVRYYVGRPDGGRSGPEGLELSPRLVSHLSTLESWTVAPY